MKEDNTYWIYITFFFSFLSLLNYLNLVIAEPDFLLFYFLHLLFPFFGFLLVYLSYKRNKNAQLLGYERVLQVVSFLMNLFLVGSTIYFFQTFEFKIM
jgi:hypothetical protein